MLCCLPLAVAYWRIDRSRIKEANSGGQAAQILAKLGYAAIILEGERSGDYFCVIRISQEGMKIAKDDRLRMLTNYQLSHKFKDEHIKNGSMISIGTAGEMRMFNPTVAVSDIDFIPGIRDKDSILTSTEWEDAERFNLC